MSDNATKAAESQAATARESEAQMRAAEARTREVAHDARAMLEANSAWVRLTESVKMEWDGNTVYTRDELLPQSYSRLFHLVSTVLSPRYTVRGTGYGRFVAVITEA